MTLEPPPFNFVNWCEKMVLEEMLKYPQYSPMKAVPEVETRAKAA